MRLDDRQAAMVEDQLDASVLPEDAPVNPTLKQVFGDHTFLLDEEGLNIVEANLPPLDSTASVIKLGTWTDEDQEELMIHEPELLPIFVEIDQPASRTLH